MFNFLKNLFHKKYETLEVEKTSLDDSIFKARAELDRLIKEKEKDGIYYSTIGYYDDGDVMYISFGKIKKEIKKLREDRGAIKTDIGLRIYFDSDGNKKIDSFSDEKYVYNDMKSFKEISRDEYEKLVKEYTDKITKILLG